MMTPLSALTYIRKNKTRSFVIALMISMTVVSIFAELYADNSRFGFETSEYTKDSFIDVSPKSGSRQILDDYCEFADNASDHAPECAKTVLYADWINVRFNDALGMDCGNDGYSFYDPEDLNVFRDHLGLSELDLSYGEMAVTRITADMWSVKVGDVVEYKQDEWEWCNCFAPTKIVKIIDDEPGYRAYRVATKGENSNNPCFLFVADKGYDNADEINLAADKIRSENPSLKVTTRTSSLNNIYEQLETMYPVIYSVVALYGVVLAITINATFVANFDKRKYEFAIYRALGISNLKIFWKVLSEVLVLDVIGLLFGSAVSAVVMFVIDASMRSRGIVFAHFSINGVLAVLICNTIVVVPVLFLNWLRVRKVDVTMY